MELGNDMERLGSSSASPDDRPDSRCGLVQIEGQIRRGRTVIRSVGLRKVLEPEIKPGSPFCGSDQG